MKFYTSTSSVCTSIMNAAPHQMIKKTTICAQQNNYVSHHVTANNSLQRILNAVLICTVILICIVMVAKFPFRALALTVGWVAGRASGL